MDYETEKNLNRSNIKLSMQEYLEREYEITPSRLVQGVTWFVVSLFIFLNCFIPLIIYLMEEDLLFSIQMGILYICIFIPIIIGAWVYSPKKYIVTEKNIEIIRPVGSIIIPIKNIFAIVDKEINEFKTLRLWGNGGLFSFTGSFYNKQDGKFWMYAKNQKYVMILADKKYVLSPDEKEQFMISIKNMIGKYSKKKK